MVLCLGGALFLCSCAGPNTAGSFDSLQGYRTLDPFMGDWQGSGKDSQGNEFDFAAQVIALGDGKYRFLTLEEFDTRKKPMHVLDGVLKKNKFVYTADNGRYIGDGTLTGETFRGTYKGPVDGWFQMHRIERLSPTLGAEPPQGAIVLFDGTNLDQWKMANANAAGQIPWKMIDGAMEVYAGSSPGYGGSIVTKRQFGDIKLHVEFKTPFMPKARGQTRGNSGVYIYHRYELQILDSYGLEGKYNDCGAVYKQKPPLVNMCAPPGQWQTYDITFHGPRLDDRGKKISNARLTVQHNAVIIHDDLEMPTPTGAARSKKEIEAGGIYLQDHKNPVQYRNIWLIEL